MAETQPSEYIDGWIASIPRSSQSQLERMRNRSRVYVNADDPDTIWLRGPQLEPELLSALRNILGCQLFRSLEDGQLIPLDAQLPEGKISIDDWTPISDWITISLPTKRIPAIDPGRAKLGLVRSHRVRSPGLLRTNLNDWVSYVRHESRARLSRLRYLASREQVLIMGDPLPTVSGEYFYLIDRIATPVGFAWSPPLDSSVLEQRFALDQDDIAILLPDGGHVIVAKNEFVVATRSSIQLTREAIDARP